MAAIAGGIGSASGHASRGDAMPGTPGPGPARLGLHRRQRTGGAYISPPLFQRLLTPRGSFSADFGPTLRSKISP